MCSAMKASIRPFSSSTFCECSKSIAPLPPSRFADLGPARGAAQHEGCGRPARPSYFKENRREKRVASSIPAYPPVRGAADLRALERGRLEERVGGIETSYHGLRRSAAAVPDRAA